MPRVWADIEYSHGSNMLFNITQELPVLLHETDQMQMGYLKIVS